MPMHKLIAIVLVAVPAAAHAQNPFSSRGFGQQVESVEPSTEAAPAARDWQWEPNRPELRIELGSRAVLTDEIALDRLTGEKTLNFFDLAVSARVVEGLSLGLRYVGADAEGSIGPIDDAEFAFDGADLLVRYTLDLIPWVAPYAEVSGGVMIADFDASAASGTLADTDAAPSFGGALGVQATYVMEHVSIGLFTDHGYHHTGALEFDEVELRTEQTQAPAVDIGSLEIDGYRWRLGVLIALRF